MILILQRNEWPRGRNSVTQLPLVTQLVRGQTGLLAQAPALVFAPHCAHSSSVQSVPETQEKKCVEEIPLRW